MYRLMIVDDHEYLIEGLRKFIDWNELNLEVLDIAANGEEGLHKIRRLRPDIVLTDISMPIMGGLEMIRELYADNLGCKFIILTGHGEFEYAREAIKYGVMDFMLKPVMPREIAEVLRRAVAACDAERRTREQEQRMKQQLLESLPVLTQRFMEELFEGAVNTSAELESRSRLLNLDFGPGPYRVLTAQIDDYAAFLAQRDESERRFVKFSMETALCEALGVKRSFLGFKERTASLLLCHGEPLGEETLAAQLATLARKLRAAHGVGLTIGVGRAGDAVAHIRDSFAQSLECLQRRGEDGGVIFYELLTRDAQPLPEASVHADPRTSRILEQVLEAIRQDYNKDITLQDLARRVYLTPNYLGTIFYKHMGRSFLDYLAQYRVQKAAELLESGKYLIYEVSEMVGYRDHDYFRRVFKDYMGVTPSQYRK